MRKTRVKLIREAFHNHSGFTSGHRDTAAYKKLWRRFKKDRRRR